MTTISLTAISKVFTNDEGRAQYVLSDVSLHLSSDRFSALIGSNGSGKTTLINIIAGLALPDSGKIELPGFSTKHPKVGYVWQNFKDSLLPWLTVEDNIAFPIRAANGTWASGRERANQLLSSLLPDVAPRAKTYQLSGGQQQMVCLLRALVAQPDVLLLDEPFSALDQHRSWNTALYFEKIWTDQRIPVLFVSHDVDEAILLADDIWLLSKHSGSIVGRVTNSLSHPRDLGMLTDSEHVRCRNEIIDFLHSENG